MAKRKRLTPANPDFLAQPSPETKTALAGAAPIADVARDAASEAAMGEMAETLSKARAEGRMILTLPLGEIETGYLVRDRLSAAPEEMQALKASLRARGQQTPVEVAEVAPGRYGLISGWRRCRALAELQAETGEARFGSVLALLRKPAEASDAYLAMVEENEIRVGLSYYERARIVAKAVEQGVFASTSEALRALFQSASRAKRSKIGSFLKVVDALDGALAFPEAMGERQGLRLAKALEAEEGVAARVRDVLGAAAPQSAEAEHDLIAAQLDRIDGAPVSEVGAGQGAGAAKRAAGRAEEPKRRAKAAPENLTLTPDLWARIEPSGALTLSGPAMTLELREALLDWLRSR